MTMPQTWFEMSEIRRRQLITAVWIPLRARSHRRSGEYGVIGHLDEFSGAGSLAVPIAHRALAEKLGWDDVGLSKDHHPWVDSKGRYKPADVFDELEGDAAGLPLVLSQHTPSGHPAVWHLHQDLVIALNLIREGDEWARPEEDYVTVARLKRDPDGSPEMLEIKAEFLRDYLCARAMALLVVSYRSRHEVVEEFSHIAWPNNRLEQRSGADRWLARVSEIHEGGTPFGVELAVFHLGRTDVDPEEDVPVFDRAENIESSSWTARARGRRVFDVRAELWRTEWIEPGAASPRVRRDKVPPSVTFIIDAAGGRETGTALRDTSRWLWFKPDVVPALLQRRAGALRWFTRYTGAVGCSPGERIHFGVSRIGLVNVFAKDIVLLPEWEQRIWAAHNVAPDGGVSEELLAAQMRARPARTVAPEARLPEALEFLNRSFRDATGASLFRDHEKTRDILRSVHRFRASSESGLLALAKDLARLISDRIDVSAVQGIAKPSKDERWGALKSLEKALATVIEPTRARLLLSPLAGIVELRHGDAHLPGNALHEALALAGVDPTERILKQGEELIASCVRAVEELATEVPKLRAR